MNVHTLIVSPFATNCYLVGDPDSGDAVVIDPGDSAQSIVETAADQKLTIKKILLTHGHTDHVGAARGVKDATSAEILIHEADVPLLADAPRMALMFGWEVGEVAEADGFLSEGDTVEVGSLSFEVIHTPGHSPGGICFKSPGIIFVGDTLFAGSIGRTDLPGGSHEQLIAKIKEKILVLPPATQVLSGHGPATTVEQEKKSNPFVGEGGGLFTF